MNLEWIKIISLEIAVACYYFQVPFSGLSQYIAVGLGLLLILNYKRIFLIFANDTPITMLYISLIVFLLLNLAYSVYLGNDFYEAVRFFLIMIVIPVCFFYEKCNMSDMAFKIFIFLSLCKVVMLLGIAAMMINEGDHSVFRLWATSNGYGDVYFDGIVPKVQLHGNALLVVAFMIDFYRKRKFDMINAFLLLGVVIAGNFAFKLGLVMFFAWFGYKTFFHRITIKKIILIIMSVVMMIMFIQYTGEEAEKKSGYNSSNAVRIAQYEVLTNTNMFIGSGLGALVKDTRINHGKIDNKYFELQTLYILYQVGPVCLLFYYYLLLMLMRRRLLVDGQVLLFIYLIYSFFNPYCFDTTEMMTIIFLALLTEPKWHYINV